MNTPAHLIVALAAVGKADRPRVNTAALLGAFAPDASLYAMATVSIWGLGIPAERVFRELYYSDAWQTVFAIDNSAILWGLGLVVALWVRSAAGFAFAGAGLLHIALDFPLHTHDGRAHFWPLTDWIFRSPVSYWDPAHYGTIVGPLEIGASLALCILLWKRFRGWLMRGLIAALALAEIAPLILWTLMFA